MKYAINEQIKFEMNLEAAKSDYQHQRITEQVKSLTSGKSTLIQRKEVIKMGKCCGGKKGCKGGGKKGK